MARAIGNEIELGTIGALTPISLIGLRDGGFVVSTAGVSTAPGAPARTGFTLLDDAGREISDLIFPTADSNGAETMGALLALSDGGFAFAWYGGLGYPTQPDQPLYLRFFDADGSPRGERIEVVRDVVSLADDNPPQLVETAAGVRLTIIGYENPALPFQLKTISHEVTFAGDVGAQVLYPDDEAALHPSTAILENGREVMVYNSGGAQNWALFDTDGEVLAANRADAFDVPSAFGNIAVDGQVTALATGGFIVSYDGFDRDTGSTAGIHAQRYDADGNPIGFRMTLSDAPESSNHSITALDNGGFFAAWLEDDDRFAGGGTRTPIAHGQEFGATGQKVGKEVTIPADFNYQSTGKPLVAKNAEDKLIAVYHDLSFTNDAPLVRQIKLSDPSDLDAPLVGNGRANTIRGSGDDDIIYAHGKGDVVKGRGGHDEIYGEGGGDRLIGGVGHDILDGGAGNDVLKGNRGNDVLVAGTGRDKMTGGAGEDVFVFRNGDGISRGVITDFEVGTDLLALTGFGRLYRENMPKQTLADNGLVVEFNTAPTQVEDYFRILLRGVDETLTMDDFVLT
jgi:hypothetical protein